MELPPPLRFLLALRTSPLRRPLNAQSDIVDVAAEVTESACGSGSPYNGRLGEQTSPGLLDSANPPP